MILVSVRRLLTRIDMARGTAPRGLGQVLRNSGLPEAPTEGMSSWISRSPSIETAHRSASIDSGIDAVLDDVRSSSPEFQIVRPQCFGRIDTEAWDMNGRAAKMVVRSDTGSSCSQVN